MHSCPGPRASAAWQDTAVPPPKATDAIPPSAVRLRPGEEVVVRIEDLAHGGAGIARRDGYVVFVDGGLPGDLVHARVVKGKRHYARARAIELVEPAPDRVPVRCDQEGPDCPGSPWQS